MWKLVEETLAHVRELSVERRPTVLDDLGLSDAVLWYTRRQAERAGYAVIVDSALGESRLPEHMETAGFRIVQEALTNVARHARAKNVRVTLGRDNGSVELSIGDNGIGFDVADAKAHAHAGESLGLIDMAELANMAGAILTVVSASGEGTIVRVLFPMGPVA